MIFNVLLKMYKIGQNFYHKIVHLVEEYQVLFAFQHEMRADIGSSISWSSESPSAD